MSSKRRVYTAAERSKVVNAIRNGMTTRQAAALVPGLSHVTASIWAKQARAKMAEPLRKAETNAALRAVVLEIDRILDQEGKVKSVGKRVLGWNERNAIELQWNSVMELARATRRLANALIQQNGGDAEPENETNTAEEESAKPA